MVEEEDVWKLIRPKSFGSCDRVLLRIWYENFRARAEAQAAWIEELRRAGKLKGDSDEDR